MQILLFEGSCCLWTDSPITGQTSRCISDHAVSLQYIERRIITKAVMFVVKGDVTLSLVAGSLQVCAGQQSAWM
jgi:hypothetical protein